MELLEYERKHLDILREYTSECCVLLKSNGDFPIKEAGDIALYGSGVRKTIKGGTGSGEVNSRFYETVEDGFAKNGFNITTGAWLDSYDEIVEKAKKSFVAQIRAEAKKAHMNAAMYGMGAIMPEPEYSLPLDGAGDVAIYVLSRISGEGSDRKPVAGEIKLSQTEISDILALNEKYEKFMLVLNVGGAVDLSPVLSVENVLILSQLGVLTGSTLARIVLGIDNPSGKLATTWSKWEDYPTIGEFGDINDTRYNEGIYVGYRYFETVGLKPLFPFGFGLSYTSFELSNSKLSCVGETITAYTRVKNVGSVPGKEVVQLYVSKPTKTLDQPYKILAGWDKTPLLPAGEPCETKIELAMSDLASYDPATGKYILEEGDYIFHIGTSSVDTEIIGAVRLGKDVVIIDSKSLFDKDAIDFEDWTPENPIRAILPEGMIPQEVSPLSFNKVTPVYDKKYDIHPDVSPMSNEQLAQLSCGAYAAKTSIGSVIGNQSFHIAGAAGESVEMADLNIPPMVMADGPAGVRISREYFVDSKGIHGVGSSLPETIVELLPKPAVMLMNFFAPKPKKDTKILNQFATALPIGTALAQSWNLDFAAACGDIVGTEMAMFGVNLWLAPALNIHRSIRCGRNFEYYSEDPLVSGRFAAALTKGVQAHPGCGVTIKHYAANSQETNRYRSNSIISERALREIYLKGFEICVKEAKPKTVMTSYNLLNGVHTAEHRILIEDILRSEFGFDGVVMTDWIVSNLTGDETKYRTTSPLAVAPAGGDLFMPGCKSDYEAILGALRDGSIDRQQVMINVSRIVKLARELGGKA